MISFGDSDGDNSDGDNSDGYGYGGVPFVGPQITPKSIEDQIKFAKQSILYSAQGLDVAKVASLKPEDIDSRIEGIRQERNIKFDPNDTELNNLNKLRKTLLQEEKEKKGGKRRKSKKYRKSRKQRKTKTKRRLRRSYKYK